MQVLPNFSDVRIFPNPVIDMLTIQFMAISEINFSVALYTESGKLLSNNIESSINGQNMLTISFAKYASGVYFIKIQQGGIEKTISVLKK